MNKKLFPANYIKADLIHEAPGLEKLIRASYPNMITNIQYSDPLWNLLIEYQDYQRSQCALEMADQLGLIYFGAANRHESLMFELSFTNQPLLIKYIKLEHAPDLYETLHKANKPIHRFIKRGHKKSFIQRFWPHASDTVVNAALRRGLTIKNFQREKIKATKYLVELLGSDELDALELIIGSVS